MSALSELGLVLTSTIPMPPASFTASDLSVRAFVAAVAEDDLPRDLRRIERRRAAIVDPAEKQSRAAVAVAPVAPADCASMNEAGPTASPSRGTVDSRAVPERDRAETRAVVRPGGDRRDPRAGMLHSAGPGPLFPADADTKIPLSRDSGTTPARVE